MCYKKAAPFIWFSSDDQNWLRNAFGVSHHRPFKDSIRPIWSIMQMLVSQKFRSKLRWCWPIYLQMPASLLQWKIRPIQLTISRTCLEYIIKLAASWVRYGMIYYIHLFWLAMIDEQKRFDSAEMTAIENMISFRFWILAPFPTVLKWTSNWLVRAYYWLFLKNPIRSHVTSRKLAPKFEVKGVATKALMELCVGQLFCRFH